MHPVDTGRVVKTPFAWSIADNAVNKKGIASIGRQR
jgi:hypothetical protein